MLCISSLNSLIADCYFVLVTCCVASYDFKQQIIFLTEILIILELQIK